jgi:hypothetical protein
MSEQEQKNQDILKKDAIIKDMQAKLVLLRNALIEERKKANALDEKNKEYINQITKLEKVIISKETEITNLTRDMLDLQEAISLEKSKNVDGSVKNVFKSVSHIFQKEGNAITEVENKKLQTTINDLKDENERIVNENKKLKTNLDEIKKTNDYQINELTIKNNKMEQSVLDKNQQIDEFMKRLELIRVADNQNMNEKKNLEIKISDLQNRNKKLKEEVDKTNNENNNQKEKINKIEEKIRKCLKENIELNIKMNQITDVVSENSTVIKKFKCEKKGKTNSKCEISFGAMEDHQYIMLITDYYNKISERINIKNIENFNLNIKDKVIEVTIKNENGKYQKYQLFSNQIGTLQKIVETYKDYNNIIKEVKNNLINIK